MVMFIRRDFEVVSVCVDSRYRISYTYLMF